ncbi:MAG: ACP S-malonyltransferase [Halanaerobiales bacterium]|nr:ACP S-malonyltransferase [Halanaerobiales bacterium]
MKFAMLFPGQGSQYKGMCKELIQDSPVAAEIFEEANSILDFDIRSLILNGNLPELTLSENAQPAVVIGSYALYRVFEEETGIIPSCAVGHSLGEISALIAAGSLSFSDGLTYVRKRGKIMHSAMEEKRGGAGIVVDLEVNALNSIVESIQANGYVIISGYNSPKQFIVAGERTALQELDKEVDKQGGEFIPFRMMPMKADAPYHTDLMTFLKPELEEALQNIRFKKPKFDIWSTVTGQIIQSTDAIKEILCNQLVLPVRWNQVLKEMCNSEITLLVDIGPKQIIRNFIKENPELPTSLSFDNEEDRKKIFKYIERMV